MKQTEIKQIVERAIDESDLNGYKWKYNNEALHWSYLDTIFKLKIIQSKFNVVKVTYQDEIFIIVSFGDSIYEDCKTLEEAIRLATIRTIQKANYLF